MGVLPSGMVTFVFTDIEGSTRLLEHLGEDAYSEALSEHHRILRQAIAAHRGVEVDTQGDAFFMVFPEAADALAATLDAQVTLARYPWPEGGAVRVRMGAHTGAGRLGGDGYVGLAVHQAARIASAAHGGQVLVSEETRLSLDTPPGGTTLRSLGRHRLRDMGAAVELHQLCHVDLEADFPAPRSLERVSHNLPIQPSSFLGRAEELAAGAKLLGATRLLSVTGPGGTGKTRLCYQLAAECLDSFPDGVWVAELAPLSDPTLVPIALASALSLRDEPGRSPTDTVVEHLRTRTALVVLDNCEHVIDAAAPLADTLLRRCERVRVIATTREPLRIAGERVWPLTPLGLPESPDLPVEALAATDAVRLFCERAAEAAAGFAITSANAAHVAAICARLDGMPLGLELAAAWMRSLSPAQIAQRLGRSLELLSKGTRGAQGRQASLRATIAWSHDLLSDAEQRLFARLAVFVGGWTLEAAEEVCAGDGVEASDVVGLLDALIDKSLVRAVGDLAGATRYGFLETIRQYAVDKLIEAGEAEAMADRHAAWCLGLARRDSNTVEGSVEQAQVFDLLTADHANLLTALDYVHEAGRSGEQASLALNLQRFWEIRGHWRLSQSELRRCLGQEGLEQALEGQLRGALGQDARALGDSSEARAHYEEALAIALELGDRRLEGLWMGLLGFVAWSVGNYPEARARYQEALVIARQLGDRRLEGRWVGGLGYVALALDDYPEARARYEEALAIARELGNRRYEGRGGGALGHVALSMGNYPEARARYQEALVIAREMGDGLFEAGWVGYLGIVAFDLGDYSEARARYEEALGIMRKLRIENAEVLEECARLLGAVGDCEGSAQLLAAADQLCRRRDGLRYFLPQREVKCVATVETCRATLGEDAFATAWKQGAQLDWAAALTKALERLAKIHA
jgi:predicted ATPase/class 3 adenylate cyclase